MKIIFVSVGNFQSYLLHNIKNLLLFKNDDIVVITNKPFFHFLEDYPVTLVNCDELSDYGFQRASQLDTQFRNGFWHYCSLRLFYVYSYIRQFEIQDCIHLENDVMTYVHFDSIRSCFQEKKVYATFDCEHRVIPGIIYIPNHESFENIIQNYQPHLNDMDNLARHDESVILPLPIFPIVDHISKYNRLFPKFHLIFDAAAIGQYLGGVDPRNIGGDTRGFVNETCVIKYDQYRFQWVQIDDLYVPYLVVGSQRYRICNLHIHSKSLDRFIANEPNETYLIPYE